MADLRELAHLACKQAVRMGAECADVTLNRDRSIGVKVEKNGIHDAKEARNTGVSVRAIVKGATAFATSSRIAPEDVREAAGRAAAAAKLAQPDPDFVSLPEPSAYEAVPGLYDERIAQMSVGDLIRTLGDGIDEAREVCPEVVVEADAGLSVHEWVLVNSLGVEAHIRRTGIGSSYFCVVRRGDDVGSFYDYDCAHMLDDYHPEGLGAKVCKDALGFLGARSVRSAVMPVVAGPLVAISLFGSIAGAAGAEHIQRKRSYLVGKRGQRIGPEFLTIRDDGFIPRGMGSGPFDGEGAARKRVTIVENGVLVNHLHGSYTAHKAKEENTGHGNRNRGVSPTNVIPSLGGVLAAEIIRDTKEGIYLNMGGLWPSLASGEISSTVDFGFKIENGELAYPLKNTMIGISIFDLLNNLDAISSDYREEPGQIMPTIRVRSVKVAGAE